MERQRRTAVGVASANYNTVGAGAAADDVTAAFGGAVVVVAVGVADVPPATIDPLVQLDLEWISLFYYGSYWCCGSRPRPDPVPIKR